LTTQAGHRTVSTISITKQKKNPIGEATVTSNPACASLGEATSKTKAEDLTAQKRENFEAFFNTIDEFLFVLDAQGNIIHTNSTVLERLGYTMDELAGKSVLMVHPEGRREEAGAIVAAMLAGKAGFCPVPIVTKSGRQIPVETRVSPGTWDGQPAIFGVTKDISRVQLSEEKFSKLFNLNPSACGLSDLVTGNYVEVNQAFTRLLGFETGEVVGRTAMELGILTEELKDVVLSKADGKGNVYNVEATLTTKNGEKKQVLLSAENIHVQDVQYRFTVVHDISEQKQSENRIKVLLDEKNMLLKEVHHRIKNNMGTMMSLLSLQAAQARDPGAIEALHNAQHRLHSMDVLYDALYRRDNFQEMEIGSYLGPLIDRILSVFPEGSSIKTECSFGDFKLDAKSLSTLGILVNELITNTLKHAFRGNHNGRIMVSARLEGSKVAFSYADNGTESHGSIDASHPAGFGLTLVEMLTSQLNGSMQVHRDSGTRYLLEFALQSA
jgi:PAS domain S-box-containing protein